MFLLFGYNPCVVGFGAKEWYMGLSRQVPHMVLFLDIFEWLRGDWNACICDEFGDGDLRVQAMFYALPQKSGMRVWLPPFHLSQGTYGDQKIGGQMTNFVEGMSNRDLGMKMLM